MLYIPRFLSLAIVCVIFASTTFAAEPAAATPVKDNSPVSKITGTLTAVTGIAISPLLGTGAYGFYQYYFQAKTPEQKASLPWYAKPSFFYMALLLAAACAAKDTFGAIVPPGLKKPADVLETIENKVSGLVAAGAVVPITMNSVSSWLTANAHDASQSVQNVGGLAVIQFAAVDFTWFLNILSIPFTLAVFALVWMASHAITVLILLSPWGAVDVVLKAARTSVLGLLTITANLDPRVSAALSLIIIVIAYFVAGWSFRLTVFGSIFCWDFFTGAKKRFKLQPVENWVFSGGKLKGVPIRTFGRLIADSQKGTAVFAYRPWLFMAERRADVTFTTPLVGKGLFFSTIRDGELTFFLLPPRYRTHEEDVARIYTLKGGVQDAGLRKAWSVLRELFSNSATETKPSTA
ncbi:MAG: hypothetical protein IPP19_06155 [Verrucomicrobia bacterium]|nr:hypothetical protein [Verrucomicrobiota bacterium]